MCSVKGAKGEAFGRRMGRERGEKEGVDKGAREQYISRAQGKDGGRSGKAATGKHKCPTYES